MEKTKSILHDILSSLEDDCEVSDIHTCVYWTAVTSLRCGLASTMAAFLYPPESHQVEYAGNLLPTGAKELWTFELPGRGQPGDFSGNEVETLLPQAEVVAITSTTLINHTLGGLLDLIVPGAYKMMLGPSTPLSLVSSIMDLMLYLVLSLLIVTKCLIVYARVQISGRCAAYAK